MPHPPPAQDGQKNTVLAVLDYTYPLAVAIIFLLTTAFNWCTLQESKAGSRKHTSKERRIALGLLFTALLAYIAQTLSYIIRALVEKGWWAPEHTTVNVLASILVWGCISSRLLTSPSPIWLPYFLSWLVGLVFELAIVVVSFPKHAAASPLDLLCVSAQGLRVACYFILSITAIYVATKSTQADCPDEERQSLLASGSDQTPAYGSVPAEDSNAPEDRDKEIKKQQRKRLEEQGGWWGYLKGFSVFLPCLWPSGNWRLQACLGFMLFNMIAQRFLNILVPRQVGLITNQLTDGSSTSGVMPWKAVLIWILFKYLSSSAGLSLINSMAECHVKNYSTQRISALAFEHVMTLSMDFHSNKDSGEVLKAVQQAGSLNDLLNVVCFDVAPILVDIVVSIFYITHLFDANMAFIVLLIGVLYVTMAFKFTAYTSPKRRVNTEAARNEHKTLYESVLNWETVTYFNRVPHEQKKYAKTVNTAIEASMSYFYAWSFSYALQSLVLTLGLLSASLLAVHQISMGEKPVGNFVTLVMYWSIMMSPLNMLTWSWKHIQVTLVDAERLLQLIQTKAAVADVPNAVKLEVPHGRVVFDNVDFCYDPRKPTLKGLTFTAEPGQTIAFVGETGGGKSTTLKLLFRFYDVTGGSISIDGQDIRSVTLTSLRDAFGSVPQDPSLFNQTIMENVRYARLDATDEEIKEACRAAAVHDKIMGFPDQYNSKVGERGVKLSGGELQRIAIARVLLANPSIVLLDEATSAVDSSIETQIQAAFKRLSTGRTTFVVAHRLSTIIGADLIIVIDQGEIIERGTHDELIQLGRKYFELWTKQTAARTSNASSVTVASPMDENAPHDDLEPGRYTKELNEAFALDRSGQMDAPQLDGNCDSKSDGTEAQKETGCFGKKAKYSGGTNGEWEEDEDASEDGGPMRIVSARPTGVTLASASRHPTTKDNQSSGMLQPTEKKES